MEKSDFPATRPPWTSRWWRVALAALLTGYFLCFNRASLRVHFALDDLGNIGHYYESSPWQLVLSNFLPWRGDSRPLGGLFYIPIYHFAGLDPMPYQAVLLLILLASVYFAYRFAILLGAGELAAWLVALACCYHGGIANLFYNAAFVFDALCCLFYLATMVYYLRIRARGQPLTAWQTLAFLGLYLCALNAKEMAVSIPVMVLVWEWFYHPPAAWKVRDLLVWARGPVRVAWLGALLTLVDIYGKVSGPQAMIQSDAYRPVFSLARMREFNVAALQELFFSWYLKPGWGFIVGMWLLLAYLAWRRADRPILRFLWWYLVVVPLPIEFLPGKREACFVLLMVGGAIFLAVVFVDAIHAAAAFATREFRLTEFARRLMVGAMVLIAVLVWVRDQRGLRDEVERNSMSTLGFETWDLIQQMRSSGFHPRHGSTVAFLDDPFHNLDMYFLARLWVHDRSVKVHVPCQEPLSAEQLAKVDYVFTIENRKVIRVR